MPEQNATETQAVEEQPQEGASRDSRTEGQAPRDEGEMVPKSRLNEVNREAKNLRDRLRKLESEQKKREDAEKSELEKATQELEALRERDRIKTERIRRSAFNEQIALPNSRWAWAAAVDAGIEIEFDENDNPTNLESVRKELRKLDPSVFGTKGADAGQKGSEQLDGTNPASSLARMLGVG